MSLVDEQFLSCTTYRRDGRAVPTPVWVVDLGDRRGAFYTSSQSGKAKRLRRSSRATLQPCGRRGEIRPGTAPVAVELRLVPELAPRVRELVKSKYGKEYYIAKVFQQVFGALKRNRIPYADTAVVFDLP